ncbi:hypothetical protein DY000_02012581 [Brassica cretica]|uniref:Uncharacterized protein n=1 Tax=Brassica cretica TaxID=69181 RepID=A0ABQ7CYQ1_BRACR|nr:hypothetical protein DY000_02012581 [Brassica cretica]
MAICRHHRKSPVRRITRTSQMRATISVNSLQTKLSRSSCYIHSGDLIWENNITKHPELAIAGSAVRHDMQIAIHILDMGVYIGGSLIGGDQQQGGLPICPGNISFAVEYLAENKLRMFVDVH